MTNRGKKVVKLVDTSELTSISILGQPRKDQPNLKKSREILIQTQDVLFVCLEKTFCDVTLAITDSNPLSTQLCFEDYDGEKEKAA